VAHLDRQRAARLMERAGMDALVLLSAEGFAHATGAAAGVATMWRRAGAVAVLVPADPGVPEVAVVSDLFAAGFRRASHIVDVRESPIWVEAGAVEALAAEGDAAAGIAALWQAEGRGADFARPETFDASVTYRHLNEALAGTGLACGRIGVEFQALSVADFPLLAKALSPAEIVDGTGVARGLRSVKSVAEIGHLRQAVGLAEVGIAAVKAAVAPGVRRSDLAAVWREAVAAAAPAKGFSGAWEYISVGPDPWGGDAVAKAGDLVKIDVGCLIEGYTSDSGRTCVIGAPSRVQGQIFEALQAGFEAGLPLLCPGTPLAEVHRVTQGAIRAKGFGAYARGHFGHSLGTGPGSEEWPFISASGGAVLEEGMVMAFECPWYLTGIGGFIVEDQVEITRD